ncbi:MAG: hypothetical protein ACOVRN_18630, partial [Flavobacterium sp.]
HKAQEFAEVFYVFFVHWFDYGFCYFVRFNWASILLFYWFANIVVNINNVSEITHFSVSFFFYFKNQNYTFVSVINRQNQQPIPGAFRYACLLLILTFIVQKSFVCLYHRHAHIVTII